MKRLLRRTTTLIATFAVLSIFPAAAYAQSWKLYDTDSLNRSTPSQNVWTTSGSFKWYDEDLDYPSGQIPDARATFTVKLNLDGADGSCARLRIITYKTAGAGIYSTSKRFPASSSTNFGYYTYCQSDGVGSTTYSGSDNLDVGYGSTWFDISKADIKICYSKKSSIAPSSDCYAFTIKKGD